MTRRTMTALLAVVTVLGVSAAVATTAQSASDGHTVSPWPHVNTAPDPAGGIYVSPSGNDATATGAVGAPFKSINAALATTKAGDTVILRGGTYREGINVRIRLPNITIKSRQGEWAVIDLTTYDTDADEDSGVYFDVGSSGGRLQGVEVMGGYYAVAMETTWRWDPDDLYTAGASNIVIEDNVLHDSRYDVVKIKPNCDNVTIRNNEIYNSGRAFAGNPLNGEDNAEGIDNVNGDNMVVQGNYIHDIVSNAIYAKGGATDALIEKNWIETAYGGGILIGFDTSVDFFDLAVNPEYYENIGAVVRDNLIVDTGWEGIGFYAAKDAEVHHNTLVNVAFGGSYHAAIYFGLSYQDWDPEAGRPATVNPKFHHNIVSQPAAIVRPMLEIRYSNDLMGMSALDGKPLMHDNCYHIKSKSAVFMDHRPGSPLASGGGLAAWQAHISGDVDSIEADPDLDADYVPSNPLCAGVRWAEGGPGSPTPSGPGSPTPSGPGSTTPSGSGSTTPSGSDTTRPAEPGTTEPSNPGTGTSTDTGGGPPAASPGQPTNPHQTPALKITRVKAGQKAIALVAGARAKVPTFGYWTGGKRAPVKWTSSKPSVAKVSKTGVITAKKPGKATIRATAAGGKKASIKVAVVKAAGYKVSQVTANVPRTMKVGAVAYVTGKYKPSTATGAVVKYSSKEKSVATIDQAGRLVAKARGTATIRVKAKGRVAEYRVAVK